MWEFCGVDSYSDQRHEFDQPVSPVEPPHDSPSAVIGNDERRMHVRAYNYWCSLLDGRDYPSIEDLDPSGISDFGPHSVLLDFTAGSDDPATPYIGTAVREECDLADDGVKQISDVPGKSLLSRLTDHYMQIIANRAPVGFEAEFVNQRGHNICYRGILMPFSSDGDTIDFIYGVINWKDAGEVPALDRVIKPAIAPIDSSFDLNEPDDDDDALELTATIADGAVASEFVSSHAPPPPTHPDYPPAPTHLTWEDGPLADTPDIDFPIESNDTSGEADDAIDAEEAPVVDDEAGLADRLWAARESAEICKQADGRSRVALYRALGMAYDFAVACKRVPDEYAEILDDAGVKSQVRAPMTPIVKLIFGVDYDKTRLTEFAAALSYAEREGVDFGAFQQFVEAADGGLKGLVAAERKARRPDRPVEDKAEIGRSRLRKAAALALTQLPTNEEFALVLTRRNGNGVHEVVELVADDALLDRALRRASR
nr:hypothetical protein [uncultured Sphingomonas sp.]